MFKKREATYAEKELVIETMKNCEKAIKNNICRLLPNKDLWQDCIHETYIIAFENINKFLLSDNREGWLYKASTYAAYRMMDSEKKYSMYTLSLEQTEIAVRTNFADVISDPVEKKKIIRLLKKYLSKANAEFFETVITENVPIKELAEKLGISEATARSKWKRLIDELRDLPDNIKEKLEFL